MSGKVVIRVENLSKHYRLGTIGGATLREDLGRWWARARGKPDPWARVDEVAPSSDGAEGFWALRDVSFEVREGEVLGVIGRNGAGKSTLLKILSRITSPTKGRALIRGRVGSLLEVGTGFHPELTGRENIYLNGAILGMTRAEITRKLDEIIEFAEMSQFIDTPVKRYSSGMTVRLAFAVAAHLDTDVLFVDEVLAVGDQAFQEKSLSKMDEVSRTGRTVLFVSHNQGMVAKLCSRGLVLHSGGVSHDGDVPNAFSRYAESIRADNLSHAGVMLGPLAGAVEIVSAEIDGRNAIAHLDVSALKGFEVSLRARVRDALTQVGARLEFRKGGVHLFSVSEARTCIGVEPYGDLQVRASIPAKLLSPGTYDVDFWIYAAGFGQWCCVKQLARLDVVPLWADDYTPSEAMGLVNLPITLTVSPSDGQASSPC